MVGEAQCVQVCSTTTDEADGNDNVFHYNYSTDFGDPFEDNNSLSNGSYLFYLSQPVRTKLILYYIRVIVIHKSLSPFSFNNKST